MLSLTSDVESFLGPSTALPPQQRIVLGALLSYWNGITLRWLTTSLDLDSFPGAFSTALPPQKRIVLGALISVGWIAYIREVLCPYWTMWDCGVTVGSGIYVDAILCSWWIEITSGSGSAKESDVESFLGAADTLLPL